MKPSNLKSVTYIEYGLEYNGKDPIFKVGDHVLRKATQQIGLRKPL